MCVRVYVCALSFMPVITVEAACNCRNVTSHVTVINITCRHRDAAVTSAVPTSHASSGTCVRHALCAAWQSAAGSVQCSCQSLSVALSLTAAAPAINTSTV